MTVLSWFILACAFAVAEIFAPGAVLIWFGFGGALTALAIWVVPGIGLGGQVAVFLSGSITSLVIWRYFGKAAKAGDSASRLNQRLVSQIGQTGELATAIVHGRGRVKLGDTTWPVLGTDLPQGAAVKIISIRDGMLVCERLA